MCIPSGLAISIIVLRGAGPLSFGTRLLPVCEDDRLPAAPLEQCVRYIQRPLKQRPYRGLNTTSVDHLASVISTQYRLMYVLWR